MEELYKEALTALMAGLTTETEDGGIRWTTSTVYDDDEWGDINEKVIIYKLYDNCYKIYYSRLSLYFIYFNNKLHCESEPAAVELDAKTERWYINGEIHREDGPAFICPAYKAWYFNGLCHKENGPAKIWENGKKEWFINGECHRENGPAVEWPDGSKEWFVNGKRYREDGPAVEYVNGYKAWYINNKLHNEKGPALITAEGKKKYFLNNEMLTEQQWKNSTKKL